MILRFLLFAVLVGLPVMAEESQAKFEAVSLRLEPHSYRLDVSKIDKHGLTYGPGTVDFYLATLSRMIRRAYGVEEYQLPKAEWLRNKYSGRAIYPKEISSEQIPSMLRTMLEERFGFRAHIEKKVVKVWLLEQAPGGAKLLPPSGKPMQVPGDPFPLKLGEAWRVSIAAALHDWLAMNSGSMLTFCNLLSREAGRPVVDRTGLEGLFDIREEVHTAYPRQIPAPSMTIPRVTVENPPLVLGPALKRLGLRLRDGKAPVEFLVVDAEPSLMFKR